MVDAEEQLVAARALLRNASSAVALIAFLIVLHARRSDPRAMGAALAFLRIKNPATINMATS